MYGRVYADSVLMLLVYFMMLALYAAQSWCMLKWTDSLLVLYDISMALYIGNELIKSDRMKCSDNIQYQSI